MLDRDPDQEIIVPKDPQAKNKIGLKQMKFSNVSSLSIFITDNYGINDDIRTQLKYIGLEGQFVSAKQKRLGAVSYEVIPQNEGKIDTKVAKSIF
ncbi:MAG: PITH domain-containing protein 1 [Paramarteilia canceri]